MEQREYTDEEITVIVKQAIMDALEAEPEEVTEDSSLIYDLGAESVDFLDIGFRLEQKFDIEMPKRNIIQRASQIYGKETFIQERELTQKGAHLLQMAMPEVDPQTIKQGIKEEDLAAFFTVKTFVNAVKEAITVKNWKPEKCSKCEKTNFTKEDKAELEFPEDEIPYGPVFRCEFCNTIITAETRDKKIFNEIMGNA